MDLEDRAGGSGLLDYINVAGTIGSVISLRLATLAELDSVYGLEDVYDLLEVAAIDAHNRRIIAKREAEAQKWRQP